MADALARALAAFGGAQVAEQDAQRKRAIEDAVLARQDAAEKRAEEQSAFNRSLALFNAGLTEDTGQPTGDDLAGTSNMGFGGIGALGQAAQVMQNAQSAPRVQFGGKTYRQGLTPRERLQQAEQQRMAGVIAKARAAMQAGDYANPAVGEAMSLRPDLSDEFRVPKPVAPKRVYDPNRGVMIDEDAGRVIPLAGLPPKPEAAITPYQEALLKIARDRLALDANRQKDRAAPPSVQTKLAGNKTVLNQIDAALAMAQDKSNVGAQQATGWKGYLPDAWLQRIDKGGNDFRAILADLGSRTIHERTGAAMGAKEWARLKGFVPTETDSHEQVITKLTRMRQALADETLAMGMPYGVATLEEIGGPSHIPEANRAGGSAPGGGGADMVRRVKGGQP